MIKAIVEDSFRALLDFLFPKGNSVLSLESLTPSELLERLPNAAPLPGNTIALWNYADPSVRELIWELKYRANSALTKKLAMVLYDVLRQELSERAFQSKSWREAPLLVPMPMFPKKKLQRGWNQTEILCEELVKLDTERNFQYSPHLLTKIRHTESQTLLKDKKHRLSNIENSMQASALSKRNVIVIDDVTTTGASFNEARRALRLAGAKEILSVALAH